MDGKLWLVSIIYFALGAATVLIPVFLSGGTLSQAQSSYTRCVTDGAPADNCARTYLLPKEK